MLSEQKTPTRILKIKHEQSIQGFERNAHYSLTVRIRPNPDQQKLQPAELAHATVWQWSSEDHYARAFAQLGICKICCICKLCNEQLQEEKCLTAVSIDRA